RRSKPSALPVPTPRATSARKIPASSPSPTTANTTSSRRTIPPSSNHPPFHANPDPRAPTLALPLTFTPVETLEQLRDRLLARFPAAKIEIVSNPGALPEHSLLLEAATAREIAL